MKRFNVIREETSANNKVDTGITKPIPQIGGPTTTNSAGPVMKPTAKKAPGSRTPRIAHQQTSGPVKEDHENEFTANKQFNINKAAKKAKSTDYFGYNAKKQVKTTVKEHIIKVGNKFRLVSKKSGKNLGTSDTKAGALKREREVEYFKHMGENSATAEIHPALRDLHSGMERHIENKNHAEFRHVYGALDTRHWGHWEGSDGSGDYDHQTLSHKSGEHLHHLVKDVEKRHKVKIHATPSEKNYITFHIRSRKLHVKEDAPAMSAGSNVAATNNPSDNYALQKDRGMKRLQKLLKRNPRALK